MGKASSFIGPFVSSAIIERSGNTNMPFTFLFALGALAVIILFLVDVDKSRVECRAYLEEEVETVYGSSVRVEGEVNRRVSLEHDIGSAEEEEARKGR